MKTRSQPARPKARPPRPESSGHPASERTVAEQIRAGLAEVADTLDREEPLEQRFVVRVAETPDAQSNGHPREAKPIIRP